MSNRVTQWTCSFRCQPRCSLAAVEHSIHTGCSFWKSLRRVHLWRCSKSWTDSRAVFSFAFFLLVWMILHSTQRWENHLWLPLLPPKIQCWTSGPPLRFSFSIIFNQPRNQFWMWTVQYPSFMDMYIYIYIYTYDASRCLCYATCPILKCFNLYQLKKIFWQPWLRCIEA